MTAADGGVIEVDVVFSPPAHTDIQGLLQPDQDLVDLPLCKVLQLCKGWVDLLVLVEGVVDALVADLVANGVFADLALERLVAVVEAVGSLVLDCLAAKPTPEAFEVDILDGTLA